MSRGRRHAQTEERMPYEKERSWEGGKILAAYSRNEEMRDEKRRVKNFRKVHDGRQS